MAQQKEHKADPIDVHVGSRLKQRRTLMGYSQEKLANSVGLTFQQVQKYERATNRISASRLYQFAKFLNVPVSYFYEDYSPSSNKRTPPGLGMADNDQEGFAVEDPMKKKETYDLLRAYYSITDPKKRQHFLKLLQSMAEDS